MSSFPSISLQKCERGNASNVTICLLLLYFIFLRKEFYVFVTHADGAVGAGFGAVPLPAVKKPRAASAQDPRKCPVIYTQINVIVIDTADTPPMASCYPYRRRSAG